MDNVTNLESSSMVTKLEKRWPLSSSEFANKFSFAFSDVHFDAFHGVRFRVIVLTKEGLNKKSK